MTAHRIIRVTGQVQGVCFRAATRDRAMELGLDGYVRNEPDGSVYIEAEGPVEALAALEEWCHHGPPAAEVDAVTSVSGTAKKMSGFSIRW